MQMKLLRVIIKFIAWLLILLGGIVMPIILYQLHAVMWGGAVEGDVIYFDAAAPSKNLAITEFAVVVAIIVSGLALEHYGTKVVDRIIRKQQRSKQETAE
jgi:hypothetical protein